MAQTETGRAWLWLLCASRVGASLPFMAYAASLPSLMHAWGMTAGEAGSIQSAFNVSYGASLVAGSALVDRAGAKRVLLWSGWLTALAAAAFALLARSWLSGLLLFGLLGAAQGGMYAPTLMLAAQGVEPNRRGIAMGWLLAASSFGYCGSIMLAAVAVQHFGYRGALLSCGAGPVLGLPALIAALWSHPNLAPERGGKSSNRLRSLTGRRALLVTLGYAAHCWEFLGMWAWMPAYLSTTVAMPPFWTAAAIHGSGGVASLAMGRVSDRFGRKPALEGLGFLGAACSFTIGWSMHPQATIMLPLAALYGFAALGDSPVLSAAMTESVEAGSMGAALAVRSVLGFGAGGLAPLAFGSVLDASHGSGLRAPWGRAFSVLGLGGAVAGLCALLLPGDNPHDTQPHSSFLDRR
jgi:MFS family permease